MLSITYTCGYCDNSVASDRGYYAVTKRTTSDEYWGQICLCPHCDSPTYFTKYSEQFPGATFGNPVNNLTSEAVAALYNEARNCMTVKAYTAAVMCCRKLLMNVAVSEGAPAGESFARYVKYLREEGHIPAKAAAWVGRIREKGNEANHEITVMEREDAEQLIRFSEMMLRIMYEYPAEL
jgi:hypothetical protein